MTKIKWILTKKVAVFCCEASEKKQKKKQQLVVQKHNMMNYQLLSITKVISGQKVVLSGFHHPPNQNKSFLP